MTIELETYQRDDGVMMVRVSPGLYLNERTLSKCGRLTPEQMARNAADVREAIARERTQREAQRAAVVHGDLDGVQ